MQADFKIIWLFFILSSSHGILKILAKVTRKSRGKCDISWTTFEKNFLFWKAKATTMQHASPATVKCIPTDPKHAF